MRITDIKAAVKTPGRWNVFVDGAYSFSLNDAQLLAAEIKLGQELDEAMLAQLKDDSEFGKAYVRALDLILRRLRSEQELHDYARRKEWLPLLRDRVIARLKEKGYINDEKFAESWVRSRTAVKPSSHRKLTLELRQKGVASHIITKVLSETGEYNEMDALRRIVEKKRHRYTDEQKFIAYLARQGFRFDDIKQVLQEPL